MFLIALREDNGAKHERVVVRQVVRVGQVTDLTERWHAINEGLPDQSLFALNMQSIELLFRRRTEGEPLN